MLHGADSGHRTGTGEPVLLGLSPSANLVGDERGTFELHYGQLGLGPGAEVAAPDVVAREAGAVWRSP